MAGALDRWVRIAGTGASFTFFGVGSLVLGLIAFPILAAVSGNETDRQMRMQRLIHHTFRAFEAFMKAVGVIAVSVPAPERFPKRGPCLVIANHPTLLDYVLLVAQMPQADVVVKKAYWSNPVTAGVVRGAGYIPNDTGEATVEECVRRIEAGRIVLLFPEGTRSPRGGLGRFQRGAAHVALATGGRALPVTVTCEPPGLMRGQPWYDVPERRMQYTFDAGEPIVAAPDGEPRGRASRSLTAAYREHFEKRLGNTDG